MKTSLIRLFAASVALAFMAVVTVPLVSFAAPAAAPTELTNPLGDKSLNLNQFIGRIINAALGLSGAVALLMFVWGGVQWLISGGNVNRIKSGKSTLTWAALGIVVIFTSYTLVNVLINALTSGSA